MIAGASKNMAAIKEGYVVTVKTINDIAAMKTINFVTLAVFCFLKFCATIACSITYTIYVQYIKYCLTA